MDKVDQNMRHLENWREHRRAGYCIRVGEKDGIKKVRFEKRLDTDVFNDA